MDFVRLHIFKFVVDWTRFEVLLTHTMASPVPAVDVEVGGTADVVAHDRGDSSGAGAEGARAGNKRPRAPKCKPGEETSGVQFKRAPQSWADEVLAASTELGARPADAASSLFANRRAADARGPVASPRPRHPVAPAPTSVDGNLPPTLGPAPNQRPDPGAGAVPPPTRHPSTGLAHARSCRALRPASSPGAPLARHGASRLRPADRDMTQTRTQYKIHCTGSLVPRRECARTVRSSSKASNPTFRPLIGSQEPTPEVLVPVINVVT